MKRLKLIVALLLSMSAIGQDDLVTARMTDYQVLYKGYPNKVIFSTNETPLCAECDTVYSTGELNEYIIKPGKGLFMKVNFSNGSEVSFKVSNLPNPTLILGGAMNGHKASLTSYHLFAKYRPEINLWASFEVLSWTLSVGGVNFEGEGMKLSKEARAHLESLKSNGYISIIAIVRGPDGIKRFLGGAFSY
ncbi:MAG: hypothetical protein ACJA1C_000683 [Crocinitomicaceae bacterium]|jgi:hypothetical protein